MPVFINILILTFLFLVLGFTADLVVKNVKIIGKKLGLRLFALGIVLGIITSLPELAVALNATVNDVARVSAGNLLGGTIVVFGLILGGSLILNREVKTDEKIDILVAEAFCIFVPLLMGLDGSYSVLDGIMLIALYSGLLALLYKINHRRADVQIEVIGETKINRALILAIVGIIAVVATSHWITSTTVTILNQTQIKQFFIGLIIFSLGTNLPEITIALTSWRRKSAELSLSHLISSAITNLPILGLIAILKPIHLSLDVTYYSLMLFTLIILSFFVLFYKTNRNLTRFEGMVLFSVYILFLLSNFWLIS